MAVRWTISTGGRRHYFEARSTCEALHQMEIVLGHPVQEMNGKVVNAKTAEAVGEIEKGGDASTAV